MGMTTTFQHPFLFATCYIHPVQSGQCSWISKNQPKTLSSKKWSLLHFFL